MTRRHPGRTETVTEHVLRAVVWVQVGRMLLMDRVRNDERGEGVISAAIAVLIMAFLGVALWFGFKATLQNTQANVDQQLDQLGK